MKTSSFLNAARASIAIVIGATDALAAETWRPAANLQYAQPGPVAEKKAMPRMSLELFSHTGFAQGDAFHLFSSGRDVNGGGIAGMFRLLPAGRVGLSARLEGSLETSRGTSYEGGTKYKANTAAAGLTLDAAAGKYLRPYVQFMGGRASAQVDLFNVGPAGDSGTDLRGEDSVLFGAGAAGVRLVTPPKSWWTGGPGLAFSVYLEGGYTVAPSFNLTVVQTPSPSKDDIPTETVRLGKLERSRAHSRLGVAVHF